MSDKFDGIIYNPIYSTSEKIVKIFEIKHPEGIHVFSKKIEELDRIFREVVSDVPATLKQRDIDEALIIIADKYCI